MTPGSLLQIDDQALLIEGKMTGDRRGLRSTPPLVGKESHLSTFFLVCYYSRVGRVRSPFLSSNSTITSYYMNYVDLSYYRLWRAK